MSESGRISWLDGWRGIAVYLMLVYHFSFDLYMFGWLSGERMFSWPMTLLQRIICCSFILCAGISARFSRGNIRRGLWCALAGLVVVAVSFAVSAPIRFGILQLLSACMILYGLAGKWTEKLPRKIAPVLWLVLFFVTKLWTESGRVQTEWLFWLGFISPGYYSYDHFPLFPWLFLFLLGAWLGGWLKEHRDLPLLQKKAPRFLTWPGQRSLWIYLLHQPIGYGLCFLISLL